jgi:hypothetical protein
MKSGNILIIYSFFVCLVLLIAGIASAKTTQDLLISLIFLPLIFYFGTKLFFIYKKNKKTNIKVPEATPKLKKEKADTTITVTTSNKSQATPADIEEIPDVPDNNKRLFLRLIGTSGLSLLLMALFTKNAQASFFGSAPTGPGVVGLKDSQGIKIDPAEKSPTDGYAITTIDSASNPAYYGFVKKDGSWYILKDDNGAYRYSKGSSDYSTNWTSRASLPYDYFNNVFS